MFFVKFIRVFPGFCVLFVLSGCYSIVAKKEFKAKLKTCYTNTKSTNGRVEIDLNGYYLMYEEGNSSYRANDAPLFQKGDSTPIYMFFFKDGIFLDNFLHRNLNPEYVQNYFNNIYGTIADTIEEFNKSSWWGSYDILGDTVKAQFFYIGHINDWFGREYWFKIIDRQTIKLIFAYPIGISVTKEQLEEYWFNNDRFSPGRLVPLQKLPSSDCWLKKEKWFWCDENQWREYMNANGYKIKRKDRIKEND